MKYLILSGGSGTRLWPLSRKLFAKQFLELINNKSLLQNSVERIFDGRNKDDIFIVSNEESRFIVMDQMFEVISDYNKNNIIIEPISKNTCFAIVYSLLYFNDEDIIVTLSSDHFIKDEKQFLSVLKKAALCIKNDSIALLGLKSDTAKQNYGYIKAGKSIGESVFEIEKFIEKPDINTATGLIGEGYYLNAGVFVFTKKALLSEVKTHYPEMFELYYNLEKKMKNNQEFSTDDFSGLSGISFDKAILEKSKNIIMVGTGFDIKDIASFQSLYEALDKDEHNNAVKMNQEDFVNVGSKGLMVYSDNRKIAAIDLSDLIIVDTPDALLISDKNSTDKVEHIVGKLREDKQNICDFHQTVYRPWGSYTVIDTGKNYQVKQLTVRPKMKISLQYHKHRSETWTVVNGVAEVIKGEEYITLFQSESVFIPANTSHRLYNPLSKETLTIIEVQTGEYLGEDDIIRMEDDFDRK